MNFVSKKVSSKIFSHLIMLALTQKKVILKLLTLPFVKSILRIQINALTILQRRFG